MIHTGALSGIQVLDLSRMLPGPYCSMILADHGARVIAIEDGRYRAEGNFVGNLYRNKQHMTLDLKTPQGKKILFRLVQKADVFIEGFRPGVVKKLGIDYPVLKEINPKLVYCAITGYGQSGGLENTPGHDVNFLSYSGVLEQIGSLGGPPVIPGIQIADIAGGAMNAAMGILLALFAREKTGQGQYVDISMTDGSLGLMQVVLFFRELFGRTPQRGDGLLSQGYACYNTYETNDGRYLSLGALEPRFWKPLCHHLGLLEFAPLQFDDSRQKEMIHQLQTLFKQKSLATWEKELAGLDICWAPVRTLDEALEDPMFKARDMVIKGEEGALQPAIGIPVKLSGTPGTLRTQPVGFGENTREVLQQLGYSDREIEAFQQEGII